MVLPYGEFLVIAFASRTVRPVPVLALPARKNGDHIEVTVEYRPPKSGFPGRLNSPLANLCGPLRANFVIETADPGRRAGQKKKRQGTGLDLDVERLAREVLAGWSLTLCRAA